MRVHIIIFEPIHVIIGRIIVEGFVVINFIYRNFLLVDSFRIEKIPYEDRKKNRLKIFDLIDHLSNI